MDFSKKREDFIQSIPNVSYVNDNSTKKQNVVELLALVNVNYLFACGDIFTKVWENEHEVEWGCKKSFFKISVYKDGSGYYYERANMLPNDIDYCE